MHRKITGNLQTENKTETMAHGIDLECKSDPDQLVFIFRRLSKLTSRECRRVINLIEKLKKSPRQ